MSRRRATAAALPGVQAEVVVAAGGEEGGLVAPALGDLKAGDVVVEGDGAFYVGDLEVDVADAGLGLMGVKVVSLMVWRL